MSFPCICLIACHIQGTMWRATLGYAKANRRYAIHRTMYMTRYKTYTWIHYSIKGEYDTWFYLMYLCHLPSSSIIYMQLDHKVAFCYHYKYFQFEVRKISSFSVTFFPFSVLASCVHIILWHQGHTSRAKPCGWGQMPGTSRNLAHTPPVRGIC